MSLVLGVEHGSVIYAGEATITVLYVKGKWKLSIDAPPHVPVNRKEVLKKSIEPLPVGYIK